MADEQSMNVKAYLDVGGGHQEVRRFGIPESLATNFSCLKEKVCNVFNLGNKDITLAWKDSEDDLIVISSDEELAEAILDCISKQKMQVFRINITLGSRADLGSSDTVPGNQQGDLHKRVICDGCQGPVVGFRYRCISCRDYDLCGACETKGMHKEHKMIRTAKSPAKGEPSFWSKEQHGPGGHFTGHLGMHGGRRYNRSGWWGRNCARGAGAGGTGQQQQQQQQEKPQQKEKQQQQKSTNNCDKDKECPWTSTRNGPCPFAEAGHHPIPSPERVAEEVQYAAQEAQKMAHHVAHHFATQMPSDQVPNVMQDIWTALSGQQAAGVGPTATSGTHTATASPSSSSADNKANGSKDQQAKNTNNSTNPAPHTLSAEEVQYVAQEAQKIAHNLAHHYATQMPSDQVPNVMHDIWTALSGQQVPGAGPTSSGTHTATASPSSSSADNKENNQHEANGSKDQQAKNTNNSTHPTNNSTNPAPHTLSAEDVQYAAQEAQKMAQHVAQHFATQMPSNQVANVMHGIWTALAGQQVPGAGPTSSATASPSSSSADNKENNQHEANGSKDQQAKNTNNSTNSAPHEQLLRTIGENVASMLEPLGIDKDQGAEPKVGQNQRRPPWSME